MAMLIYGLAIGWPAVKSGSYDHIWLKFTIPGLLITMTTHPFIIWLGRRNNRAAARSTLQ
jgi:hypothetical protein